jgi:hypothetical protein
MPSPLTGVLLFCFLTSPSTSSTDFVAIVPYAATAPFLHAVNWSSYVLAFHLDSLARWQLILTSLSSWMLLSYNQCHASIFCPKPEANSHPWWIASARQV